MAFDAEDAGGGAEVRAVAKAAGEEVDRDGSTVRRWAGTGWGWAVAGHVGVVACDAVFFCLLGP